MPTPSRMLKDWCQEVLRELNEHFPPAIYGLYRPDTNLPHYQNLATRLEARFEDPILAKSAFLHGIHTQELRRLPPGLLEKSVQNVLEEREKLRALSARDPDVREQLLTNVLPHLRDARAVMLLIVEQLHHLDCDDRLSEWSREFHRRPEAPPPGIEIKFKDKAALAECQGFIESVVAPTAKFFGLQHECNVLEDASLVHFDRGLFDEVLTFVLAESAPGGECGRLCRLLADNLVDLAERPEICWEWRHIGSLARMFPLKTGEKREKQKEGGDRSRSKFLEDRRRGFQRVLDKTGFVTVACPDDASCYHALHLIHRNFRHRPTEIRDRLAKPAQDGYRALHTILTLDENDKPTSGPEAVSVRIMPTIETSCRYRSAGRSHIDVIAKRLTSGTGLRMRVFAPDGRGLELPIGATVLEFANALNHSWLVHLAGVTVNRRTANLLHRLSPGDVVWLDISPEFLALPKGWETRIASKATAKQITKEFRFHFLPFLENVGRSWLRERLRLQESLHLLPEDYDLDSLIEDIAPKIGLCGKVQKSSSVLRSLGIIHFEGRGEDLGFKRNFSENLATRLVKKIAKEIRNRGILIAGELDIPENLLLLAQRIILCPDCIPSLNMPLLGLLEGDTLVLHREGFECGEGGISVYRKRITTRPQFFALEMKNRLGIAAEVLAIFQRYLVSVTEFIGMERGRQGAVVRIKTDRISQRRVREIISDLKAIPGVTRLAPPDAGEPEWEEFLPPRRRPELDDLTPPAPYLCGNEINDDNYFYGMVNARAELRKIFDDTVHPDMREGEVAFIKGPLRSGKTSIVKFFLRELDRRSYSPCLTAYYQNPLRGTPWSKAEEMICQVLLRQARGLADKFQIDFDVPKGKLPLMELVEHIQDQINCAVVLALDEIVGLFQESAHAGESEGICSLCSQIQARPKFLMLCIGPASQVRHLPTELRSILSHAAQVPIEALTLDETKRLLRAENFGIKYRIRIPHRLAESIHQMTGGSPYWISNLGSRMWNRRENRKNGVVSYTEEHLRLAINKVFHDNDIFEHCLLDSPSFPGLRTLRVLTLLAGSGEDARKLGCYSSVALGEQLRREEVNLTTEDLGLLLDELQAQGSVLPVQDEEGRQLWSVSNSLLRDYLRYLVQPDRRGNCSWVGL